MPLRPGLHNNTNDTSSSDAISYDTDAIRETADRIIARVGTALDTHTSTWNAIQSYLDGEKAYQNALPSVRQGWVSTSEGAMPDVYSLIRAVLEPHEKRLRDSFNLQLSFAEALFNLADRIDQAEQMNLAGHS